jgi:hypothetical protein
MLRPFVSRFVLPLVKGGPLYVGRPVDDRAIVAWTKAFSGPELERIDRLAPSDLHAASELGFLRTRIARTLLLDIAPPPLDEESLRLAATVHNVLLLTHPALGDDPGDRTRQRIAETALTLAALGPPASAEIAVRRHSLLTRLPEIVQPERIVTHWLGKQRFVGRTPPARLLAMPRLRRVRLDEVRRSWLREVGISALARPAWQELLTASPLGEALDPLRLEPPLSFARVLPVLRFPSLARLAASRVLELGLVVAGSAYASALFRYASLRESLTGAVAPRRGVALGIGFLAHALWLALLAGDLEIEDDGGELADLLVAAADVDPRLIYPPDVAPASGVGQRMRAIIDKWRVSCLARRDARYRMALGVAQHAAIVFEEPPASALMRQEPSGL